MMYEKYFQFDRPPFNLTPDPQFFFFSKHHEEAFSQIIYGIQERKGFILITGEVGTGKTTLCRQLLEHLDRQVKTALIFNPNLTTVEMLQTINQDFGIGGSGTTKKALLDELNQYLLGALSRGENAAVIIDEAQNLSVECLEEIRMLSNLETTREKLVQIVLVGQPELRQKLGLSQLRQLNQRIALRYHLEPLDLDMAREYISFRLRVAGGVDRVHFTTGALQQIHQFSHGIPRLINVICDKSLLAAYVAESRVVTPSMVKNALADLEPIPSYRGVSWSLLNKPLAWSKPLLAGAALVALLGSGLFWSWNPKSEVLVQETSLPPAENLAQVPQAAVEPPPAPIRQAEEVPIPVPQAASYTFDADGIYRVEDPVEVERAAYLTMARLWQSVVGAEVAITPQEFSEMDLAKLLKTWGLYQYPLSSSYQRILGLAYPCMIWIRTEKESQPRPVVLASVSGEQLTLLDPLDGKRSISAEEFQAGFTGQGLLFWREIPGISLPLVQGVSDASVRTLQAILQVWGLYKGPVDGILGSLTQTAIKAFQQERGLEATGHVGMETYLILAQTVLGHKVPTLYESAQRAQSLPAGHLPVRQAGAGPSVQQGGILQSGSQ